MVAGANVFWLLCNSVLGSTHCYPALEMWLWRGVYSLAESEKEPTVAWRFLSPSLNHLLLSPTSYFLSAISNISSGRFNTLH